MNERRLTRKAKRRFMRIQRMISALCIAVLIFGAIYIYQMGQQYAREREKNQRIKETYYAAQNYVASAEEIEISLEPDLSALTAPTAGGATMNPEDPAAIGQSASTEPTPSATADNEPTGPVLQPAFKPLYEVNPDVIGWIQMADCVDYPIVWRDNTFYMDHNFEGDESITGAIFLDERNLWDMSDSSLLIYGHNMRDGSMFGELDRYRKVEYLREYPIITIQQAWEEEPRKYVLISMFDASMNPNDRYYLRITRTEFETPEEKEEFIDELYRRSLYSIKVKTNAEDQLLTLITCSYSYNNSRLLIFARELREDETEEQILEAFKTMKLN